MTLEQEILIRETKAREEGCAEERFQLAKRLKAEGVSLGIIVKCSGLTEEDIKEL